MEFTVDVQWLIGYVIVPLVAAFIGAFFGCGIRIKIRDSRKSKTGDVSGNNVQNSDNVHIGR